MTREERQKARRTERRKARQADHVLTAAVRALGAGDVDHWSGDTGDNATPVSGDFGGVGE